jgi:hypothetical protein
VMSKSILQYVLVECCVPGLKLSGSNPNLAFFSLVVAAPTKVQHLSVFPMDMLQIKLLFLPKSGTCQNLSLHICCSLNENTIDPFSYFSSILSSDITTESSCWF